MFSFESVGGILYKTIMITSNAYLENLAAKFVVDGQLLAPENGLQLAAKMLDSETIARTDLVIDGSFPSKDLGRHRLLFSADAMDGSFEHSWMCLSGAGLLGNNAYGDLRDDEALDRFNKAFKRPILASHMLRSVQAPGALTERLGQCLRLCRQAQVVAEAPEVVRALQRQLSDILLSHPVLMHPRFMVPVAKAGTVSYMNVLHAVAECGAGLPRRSHFTVSGGGLGAELLPQGVAADLTTEQRLRDFGAHPCVRLALGDQRSVHVDRGPHRATLQGEPLPAIVNFGQKRLMEFAFGLPAVRDQFWASVMELEELKVQRQADMFAGPGAPATDLPFPLSTYGWMPLDEEGNSDASAQESENLLLVRSLAASFFGAAGLKGVAGTHRGRLPEDAGFMECIRKRSDVLGVPGALDTQIGLQVPRRIFLGRQDDLTPQVARSNAAAVVAGLVQAGLKKNTKDAGTFILNWTLGRLRNNEQLPNASHSVAAEFFRAIEDSGALVEVSAKAKSDPLAKVLDAVVNFPGHDIPNRGVWKTTIEVFERERLMRTIVNRARLGAVDSMSLHSIIGVERLTDVNSAMSLNLPNEVERLTPTAADVAVARVASANVAESAPRRRFGL